MKKEWIVKALVFLIVCSIVYVAGCDNDSNTLKPIKPSGPDTIAPTVQIIEPEDGDSLLEGEYCFVTAEIWDNVSVANSEMFVNGEKRGEDNRSPYEFSFFMSEQNPDQTYEIYIRAYDTAGNSGSCPSITVKSYHIEK